VAGPHPDSLLLSLLPSSLPLLLLLLLLLPTTREVVLSIDRTAAQRRHRAIFPARSCKSPDGDGRGEVRPTRRDAIVAR